MSQYLGPSRRRRILEQIPESLAQPAQSRLAKVLLLVALGRLPALVSQRQSQNDVVVSVKLDFSGAELVLVI